MADKCVLCGDAVIKRDYPEQPPLCEWHKRTARVTITRSTSSVSIGEDTAAELFIDIFVLLAIIGLVVWAVLSQ
jgi:hypothetical protein